MIMQLDTHPECQPDECFTGNTNAGALRVGDIAYRRDGSILPGYHPIFAKEPQIPCNISHSAATKIAALTLTGCPFKLDVQRKIVVALATPGATSRYSIESAEDYTLFIRRICRTDHKITVNYTNSVYVYYKGQIMCSIVDKYIILAPDCSTTFHVIVKQICKPDFEDITINLTVAQERALNQLQIIIGN